MQTRKGEREEEKKRKRRVLELVILSYSFREDKTYSSIKPVISDKAYRGVPVASGGGGTKKPLS